MGLGEVLEDKQGKKVESKRQGRAGSSEEELIKVGQLEKREKEPDLLLALKFFSSGGKKKINILFK